MLDEFDEFFKFLIFESVASNELLAQVYLYRISSNILRTYVLWYVL